MSAYLATVKLYDSKHQICASLDGRHGHGPTPAAALRDLAAQLDQISGNTQPQRSSHEHTAGI